MPVEQVWSLLFFYYAFATFFMLLFIDEWSTSIVFLGPTIIIILLTCTLLGMRILRVSETEAYSPQKENIGPTIDRLLPVPMSFSENSLFLICKEGESCIE